MCHLEQKRCNEKFTNTSGKEFMLFLMDLELWELSYGVATAILWPWQATLKWMRGRGEIQGMRYGILDTWVSHQYIPVYLEFFIII